MKQHYNHYTKGRHGHHMWVCMGGKEGGEGSERASSIFFIKNGEPQINYDRKIIELNGDYKIRDIKSQNNFIKKS